VPSKKEAAAEVGGEAATEQKPGWGNVFKFNSAKEKRHDDPALGET
jgi:hypothetical protein